MSHCVPNWDIDDYPDRNLDPGYRKPDLHASSNSMSSNLDAPILDYAVAELTWKNGQLAMHELNPPRVANKPHAPPTTTTLTWDKPRAAETLESIVNQATLPPPTHHHKPQLDIYAASDLVPWLDHHSSAAAATNAAGSGGVSVTMTMDALVPSSNIQQSQSPATAAAALRSGGGGRCSTRVASCSGEQSGFVDQRVRGGGGGCTAATAAATATHEWSSCRDQSVSGSANFGMESSRQLTVETCERELGVKGFTSTSMGSPENTISGGKRSTKSTSPDEHDSVCHSRPQSNMEDKKKGKGKSSISTKRSRAAAIHNQSERKRRDKINQKMKTLQKLVPNANKTDKASMLDEVIEYLKQLQAQIHMMSRMNMSPMMMPLAMQQQQQIQMAMMNPLMGIGMGMGMGMPGVMDLNTIGGNRSNIPGMPPVFHPSTFMQPPMASWDMHTSSDRVTNPNDPMAAFLACQSQPMTMDAYSRMATLFQQMQNQSCYSGLKN